MDHHSLTAKFEEIKKDIENKTKRLQELRGEKVRDVNEAKKEEGVVHTIEHDLQTEQAKLQKDAQEVANDDKEIKEIEGDINRLRSDMKRMEDELKRLDEHQKAA